MDSEPPRKTGNSSKQKRVEMPLTWGKAMTGLRSAGYKTKKSDRTLTGAMLEWEIPSQCGEITLKDFKPSCRNAGKGSVTGQLIPVEYNLIPVD